MRSEIVRLFQTLPHACGYYGERTAQNLVIDPSAPQLPTLYDNALTRGFRRAGSHVYHPQCVKCSACVACRVPSARFKPDRSQRRNLAINAALSVRVAPAGYSVERFDLYHRYLKARHSAGGMDDATPGDFSRFLYTDWTPTKFIEISRDGRLLAVAVTDVCSTGLSAVYTFFDPDENAHGLGTFAILSQIRIAQEQKLPHVYLGYWIAHHPKMDYKRRFRPLEVLADGAWRDL
ncbi:MAG: arginyltransferase [Dokdonella sp.]